MTDTCRLPGCTTRVDTSGLCSTHYRSRLISGEVGYVDKGPIVAHVRSLMEQGWAYTTVAHEAGVSHPTVRRMLLDEQRKVRMATARALLSVTPRLGCSRAATDATGTRRRLEALNWMGWNNEQVSAEAGLRSLSKILYRNRVSLGTAVAVKEAYERLSDRQGASRRAAVVARGRGYAPPMAWDGLDMDDPKVKPAGVRNKARKQAPVATPPISVAPDIPTAVERWHGTSGGYNNHKCRCAPCTGAWRSTLAGLRQRRYSQRVSVDGVLIHPTATHGKYTSHSNYGCRCEPCASAWRDYLSGLKERRRAA